MCGIAGILTTDGSPHRADLVRAMVGCISHRGPDDETVLGLGPVALGHRRLSILDTSTDGNQPMQSADGRYWIIHNGEIYNFLELADELQTRGHVIRTATDTEVIVAAYREWGPDCVNRFNGIWAFALWDSLGEELFLSRDRFGVKPLYIARVGGAFAFSSEIKALLSIPGASRDIDESVVRDFIVAGRNDHTDRTFFAEIHAVPAASNVVVSRTSTRQWRYWQPNALATDFSIAARPSDRSDLGKIRETLIDAVRLQLRSDVALGTCLSGGIDSSAIVAIANGIRHGAFGESPDRHSERDQHPHSAFFADFPDAGIAERRYVDSMIAATGMELHTASPTADEFVSSLRDVVWHQDEPFGSASIVAQYHVMKLAAANGMKVLLDGQGADEIFAGYPGYEGARVEPLVRSAALPGLIANAIRRGETRSLRRLAWALVGGGRARPGQSREIQAWIGPRLKTAPPLTASTQGMAGTPLAKALWRDITSTNLPGLLRYEDRNSMAFGIEARVPFLDHRLVERALLLPDRLKISGDVRKLALRHAVQEIVPEQIVARRDKIGFAAPEVRWLTAARPEMSWLGEAPISEERGLIARGGVQWALANAAKPAGAGWPAWRVLSLELWLNICVESQTSD
jgi:asparagine synthase (glutamine-hydrolysing)